MYQRVNIFWQSSWSSFRDVGMQTAVCFSPFALPKGSGAGASVVFLAPVSVRLPGYITELPRQWSPVIWALSSPALKVHALQNPWREQTGAHRVLTLKWDKFTETMWGALKIVTCRMLHTGGDYWRFRSVSHKRLLKLQSVSADLRPSRCLCNTWKGVTSPNRGVISQHVAWEVGTVTYTQVMIHITLVILL